jgi:hypothetical protein
VLRSSGVVGRSSVIGGVILECLGGVLIGDPGAVAGVSVGCSVKHRGTVVY